jgi:AmmeMemoRadiSam system protein A
MTASFPLETRRQILGIARSAIEARLIGRNAGPAIGGDARLREPRGAFVTLSMRGSGELRGCVGYVEPVLPLGEAVARAAAAAAFEDDRFAPLSATELPLLTIDVSVLERPRPLRPEDVEVGRHGLIVAAHGRRGLLLPQVPVEHHWDRETFLDHTCRKAGLPKDAWREQGTELLAFTAEVFGEADVAPL